MLVKCIIMNIRLLYVEAVLILLLIQAACDTRSCLKNRCQAKSQVCDNDPNCWSVTDSCSKRCENMTSNACWSFCLAGKNNTAANELAICGLR
jgi:hypothetical protein